MKPSENHGSGNPVLLTPGPAGTSETVRQSLLRGDWGHREPEFAALLAEIRQRLAGTLAPGHEALLVTGSGTAAMELAVTCSVRPGRALLVVRNGVYGDRLARMAEAAGIDVVPVHGPWTEPVDPELVRRELARHPEVDAVACVQHETTTGLANPVDAIGEVVAATDALFVLDAISATAVEDLGHPETGAHFIGGTANKGLHGLPGISFVLVDARAERRMREVPCRSVYFDGAGHLDAQRAGGVLFTPAVQVCFALNQALAEFEQAGGHRARSAAYRERARQLRADCAELGLEPIVAGPHRANSVSMFPLPPGFTYPRLHDALRARGFAVYAGQSGYAAGHFRVATMGELGPDTLAEFAGALRGVLAAG